MPIVHPCSLLLENKAFLLQKEKQNIMKTKLLTLLMLFGLFSPLSVYGDNVPTKGEWHDDYYRSVTPAPPTLSIDGNLLSIHFIDALDDLTVQVVNEQGAILYNEVVSGEAGECVSISLDQAGTGCFYLVLEHRLGQLTGDFIIQNNQVLFFIICKLQD